MTTKTLLHASLIKNIFVILSMKNTYLSEFKVIQKGKTHMASCIVAHILWLFDCDQLNNWHIEQEETFSHLGTNYYVYIRIK